MFEKFDLDMYQYKGQGRIFEKCGTKFVPSGTKISKKNNFKQKSYEDFSVLKINKSTKNNDFHSIIFYEEKFNAKRSVLKMSGLKRPEI